MKRNIVLIAMDTARAFNFSFYGYDRDTSPFLSSKVEDNTLVKKAYSTAPWTAPSHASIFTGKYPNEHGTTSESLFLHENKLTRELSDSGYNCIGISNNPILTPSLNFDDNFDSYFESEDIDFKTRNLEALIEFRDKQNNLSGLERYFEFLRVCAKNKDFRSLAYGAAYFLGFWQANSYDSGAKKTNELVKKFISEYNREEPFFLFLNYMEPHTPYKPPKSHAKYLDNYEDLSYIQKELKDVPKAEWDDSEELSQKVQDAYDSELYYLDSKLNELYNSLEENTDRETIYVFVGDHGENLGEFDMYNHMFGIWETLIRVPMIIAGDSVSSKVVKENFSLRKIFDAILEEGLDDIEEYTEEEVFAEFEGSNGFFFNYGNNDLSDVESDKKNLITRKAKTIVESRLGATFYQDEDNYFFKPQENGFSEDSVKVDQDNISRLKVKTKKATAWFGETLSDIDI